MAIRKRQWTAAGAVLLALAAVLQVRPLIVGLPVVVRAADFRGLIRRIADADRSAISTRLVTADARTPLRARVYTPADKPRQTILLVSGLHPAGIDEPRLVRLARTLAEAGATVVTPDLPQLVQFEITPALTDGIEHAAAWLAGDAALAPAGRIGLIGISFSGALAMVAAGRPALRGRLRYVLSFGGYDDLARELEYLCGQADVYGRDERPPAPHDYGVAIVLLALADRVVPPGQVVALRDGVRRYLGASALDQVDKARARREFAAVQQLARTLPPPSDRLLTYVANRDVAHLGAILRPYVGSYAPAAGLSPSRSPIPSAPVYLLHGRDDNVIPAAESRASAARLRGRVPVRLLVSDLISHAEADRPAHVLDVLSLASFWGDLLLE